MSKTTEELMARVAELEADVAQRTAGPQSLGQTFKSASGKSQNIFVKLSEPWKAGVPTMVALATEAADKGVDAVGFSITEIGEGRYEVKAFIPTKKKN